MGLMGWAWLMRQTLNWHRSSLDGCRRWCSDGWGWVLCEGGRGCPCYLHVGEGAGQGAGTRPPLLLQSATQHLKLPLLLPHWGQQGGRTRALLHSHAEGRARGGTRGQVRAGRGKPTPGVGKKNRQTDTKNRVNIKKAKGPTYNRTETLKETAAEQEK